MVNPGRIGRLHYSMESTDVTETPEEETVWPVQDQIAAYLRDGILNGDFPPGKALPSSRKLHDQFGAAAQTIKNAMEILEREGLVYTRRGAGVFAREHRQRTMTPAEYKNPPTDGGKYQWITAAERKAPPVEPNSWTSRRLYRRISSAKLRARQRGNRNPAPPGTAPG